jgi:hypothetical protein
MQEKDAGEVCNVLIRAFGNMQDAPRSRTVDKSTNKVFQIPGAGNNTGTGQRAESEKWKRTRPSFLGKQNKTNGSQKRDRVENGIWHDVIQKVHTQSNQHRRIM